MSERERFEAFLSGLDVDWKNEWAGKLDILPNGFVVFRPGILKELEHHLPHQPPPGAGLMVYTSDQSIDGVSND